MIYPASQKLLQLTDSNKTPLLFFDGYCNYCSRIVQWLLGKKMLIPVYFSPLQSSVGEAFQAYVNQQNGKPVESIIFLHNKNIYTESDAVFEVGKLVKGYKALTIAGSWSPRFLTDACYRFIMRHRYQWFGKSETCKVPKQEEAHLFINQ